MGHSSVDRTWWECLPGFYGHTAIRRTADGEITTTLEPPVPRISDDLLNSVIYLYGTQDAAEQGVHYGGSGFLVGIRPETEGLTGKFVYAVTNAHVIEDAPVIRFNRPVTGLAAYVPTEPWRVSPDHDVAVLPLAIDWTQVASAGIGTGLFATQHLFEIGEIGAGDECFMLGRYVNADGRDLANRPIARFGNLARATTELLEHDFFPERMEESFLVEMRSLSGFSGSPVFTYNLGIELTEGKPRGVPLREDDTWLLAARTPWLLGINWCELPWQSSVYSGPEGKEKPIPDTWAFQNSGIAGVVPAWKLAELLEDPELKDRRAEAERKETRRARPARGHSTSNRDETYSRGDFMKDLGRVSAPEQPDPGD